MFIENMGQFDDRVQFFVPGSLGNGLWITDDGLWVALTDHLESSVERTVTLKLTLLGANRNARLEPIKRLNSQISYLQGADTDTWLSNVPVWQGVRYRDFYPGYNLEIDSIKGKLAWRLIASQSGYAITQPLPDVRLHIDGAQATQATETSLLLTTSAGNLILPLLDVISADAHPTEMIPLKINERSRNDGSEIIAPFVQRMSDQRTPANTGQPTVQTSAYVAYSGFLGGSDDECILNCVLAVDAGGSAYIAGYTRSPDFPTSVGVYSRSAKGGTDIFVAKVSLDGRQLDYATFIGGSGSDFSSAIAVDARGQAYVTGYTASQDFPTTINALQPQYGGGFADAFIVKVSASGANLAYSSYLGGLSNDIGADVAVDRSGNAFVTGETQSPDFPTSGANAGAHTGSSDAFIARIDPTGSRLIYSAYIGGKGRDDGRAIAIDVIGNAYVTGRTTSTDFPTTANALARERNGLADVYVLKMNANGTAINYATLIGGKSNEQSNGIAVDSTGRAYIVGSTLSSDFPTTENAFDQEYGAGFDAFVAKLMPDGSGLDYATFLGGSSGDRGIDIALDKGNNAYVTGFTYSTDFPTTERAVDLIHDGDFADAFVVKLNADASSMSYSTFLGGDRTDYGTAIAVDGEGSAYVVGATQSTAYPSSPSVFGETYHGKWDGFITKLAVGNEEASEFIAGVVRDQNGLGVPGVVISAGASGSTTTDENGSFSLIGLNDGIYTLTPIKDGHSFSPNRRTVTVPSSEGLQVFTSAAEGTPPEPFLDLPFDYNNSPATFLQALRDTSDGGWVTSWFDHGYPDYAKNQNLILWDGKARTTGLFNQSLGCYESRCYDDHNGTDMAYRIFNSPDKAREGVEIRAAADGTVVAQRSDCRGGNRRCGGGYGNQVIIFHENGYFTHYGHLASVNVRGQTVKMGDLIGIMGSTGNSTGPHLHFSLYRDDGNGKWDGDEIDKALDPFGWYGSEGDPWVLDRQGPVSHYLWRYPLSQVKAFAGQQGTVIKDTSGALTVEVPPDAFSGEVSMELFLGPVAGNPRGTRSVGQAFWLRLLEWLPGQNQQSQNSLSTVASALDNALTKPITVSAAYTESQVKHLNVNQMTLARWNEATRSWENLPTDINKTARIATAQTTGMGDFELQAPLICPADSVEPDDAYFSARSIQPGEASTARLFDMASDEDWFYLVADGGTTYIIQTLNLATGVDPIIEVYSVDSKTRLAVNDDGGIGLAAYLQWTAPRDGFFFIRVLQADESAFGCTARYSLNVTAKRDAIFLPLIRK